MSTPAFSPMGSTVNLAATTSTGNVALSGFGVGGGNVRLYNSGSVVVFVNFGGAAVTAVLTTSMPLAPGASEVFAVGEGQYMAGITASGSATVYATIGQGV